MGKNIIAVILFCGVIGIIVYISQPKQTPTAVLPFAVSPTPGLSQIPEQFQPIQNVEQNQKIQQAQQQVESQQLQKALADVKTASITALIRTNKGDIKLVLYGSDAPITVYNFVDKARNGFFNGLTFHRVEEWVIQGGDPKGDGTGGGDIPTEFNSKPFIPGSLGVARRQDPKVQNDSQFFITKTDASHLNNLYTNFGMVLEGMETVGKIEKGDTISKITVTQTQ